MSSVVFFLFVCLSRLTAIHVFISYRQLTRGYRGKLGRGFGAAVQLGNHHHSSGNFAHGDS